MTVGTSLGVMLAGCGLMARIAALHAAALGATNVADLNGLSVMWLLAGAVPIVADAVCGGWR
jgi:hypothetical protein